MRQTRTDYELWQRSSLDQTLNQTRTLLRPALYKQAHGSSTPSALSSFSASRFAHVRMLVSGLAFRPKPSMHTAMTHVAYLRRSSPLPSVKVRCSGAAVQAPAPELVMKRRLTTRTARDPRQPRTQATSCPRRPPSCLNVLS